MSGKQRDRTIEITIADNGIGMNADTLAPAFEPFFRAPGAAGAGHGLGLSIVRRTVESIGGSISLTSTEHEGTRVTVTLPASEPDLEVG